MHRFCFALPLLLLPCAALAAEDPDYVVYFGHDRAVIEGRAEEVVARAVADMLATPDVDYDVQVNGHTDTTGPAEYNMGLSHRRAQAVVERLLSQGVPENWVRAYGFGETDPAVPTKDEVSEPRNRRVEVVVGRASPASPTPASPTAEDAPAPAVETTPEPAPEPAPEAAAEPASEPAPESAKPSEPAHE